MKQINLINFCIAFLISTIFGTSVSGQSNNPAAASGYLEDDQEFWDNTPHLILSAESDNWDLPTEVDNSQLMYFVRRIDPETGLPQRQIYIQGGNGACAAVSTVHYTLTYELNRVRELYGLYDENKCPANFSWNFFKWRCFWCRFFIYR